MIGVINIIFIQRIVYVNVLCKFIPNKGKCLNIYSFYSFKNLYSLIRYRAWKFMMGRSIYTVLFNKNRLFGLYEVK